MLGKWKKGRLFKLIDYFALRQSRSIIHDLRISHARQIADITSGTIETIDRFRNQHDYQIAILKEDNKRSLYDLHNETERKIKAIENESDKVRLEMNDTIDQLSKEMSKISKSEHIYEAGFMEITSELKRMLPQIRAALQAIQIAASNIETIHQSVQSDIGKIKKSTKTEDILRKNQLKARG